ncbi:MAG: hypothetical protein ACI955_000313 [Zhongshania sp.]
MLKIVIWLTLSAGGLILVLGWNTAINKNQYTVCTIIKTLRSSIKNRIVIAARYKVIDSADLQRGRFSQCGRR